SVTERADEQPLPGGVDREVIDPTLDARQRNDSNLGQRLCRCHADESADHREGRHRRAHMHMLSLHSSAGNTAMRTSHLAAIVAVGTSVFAAPAKPPPLPLSLVEDLRLPGDTTRFDYQWLDTVTRRLYIAHLGDSSLVVFDLDSGKVIHEVPK